MLPDTTYLSLVYSKTPGTEDGVLEPIPTFSTCYSAPFIVLHVSFLLILSFVVHRSLTRSRSLAVMPRCSQIAWPNTKSIVG